MAINRGAVQPQRQAQTALVGYDIQEDEEEIPPGYLKGGLVGPSGAGKSVVSLYTAHYLLGHDPAKIMQMSPQERKNLDTGILVLDTENSCQHYLRPVWGFKFRRVTPPEFRPADLARFVAQVVKDGYRCLIIDSFSAYWEGSGGMLESVNDSTAAQGGNTDLYYGWNAMGPPEKKMFKLLFNSDLHIILTMRVKYSTHVPNNASTDASGAFPRTMGLDVVQRKGVLYSPYLFVRLDPENHFAKVEKAQFDKPRKWQGKTFQRVTYQFAEYAATCLGVQGVCIPSTAAAK